MSDILVRLGCHNKMYRLGSLNNRNLFSQNYKGGNVQDQVGFLVRVLFHACRWLPSGSHSTHREGKRGGRDLFLIRILILSD